MKEVIQFIDAFFKNKGTWVFASTLFNKVTVLIISIIAAHLLQPEYYGEILIITGIFNLILPMSGFGSTQGLMRFGILQSTDREREILTSYVFWKGILYQLLVTLLFLIITSFYIVKFENIFIISLFFAFRLIGYFFFTLLQTEYRMVNNNKMFSIITIWINFINLILVLVLTYLFEEYGFLIAMAITPWFCFFIKKPKINFKNIVPNIDLKSFWKFSYNSFSTSFISGFLFSLDVIMLGIYLNETSVALYKVAILLPMNLSFIPLTFIQSGYPILIKNSENKEYLEFFISNYYKIFIPFGIIVLIIGYYIKDFIVPFVFGPEYQNGTETTFYILLWAMVLNMWFRNLYLNLTSATKNVRWNTYTVVISLVVAVLLMAILIPKFGILGAAISMLISFTFSGFLSMGFFMNYLKKLELRNGN